MTPVLIPIAREADRSYVPLRRSLPAPPDTAHRDAWRTALLAAVGVAVFVDIEFALAYVLYFATHALN